MKVTGTTHKYGSNVDTDVIIPARYLNVSDAALLAAHCMEDIDSGFASAVKRGDIIVAGKNFGCGSSREHAPIAIKASGIACVVALTFARIFYRNAINIGLPILECAKASECVAAGDAVSVDLALGRIINHTRNEVYQAAPFPPFMHEIIAEGGLVLHTKKTMGTNRGLA